MLSGGDVTVAKLFVNNNTGNIGLVGYWDVVAFDEFAGRNKRPSNKLVDIMKNYMANKSFSRGRDVLNAEASMVFVGNTDRSVAYMLRHSDLFEALPERYHDSAFLDRLHYYLPGWEIAKLRNEMFSTGYGFVVDYLAEALRYLRDKDFSSIAKTQLSFSNEMTSRDRDGVTDRGRPRRERHGVVTVLVLDGERRRSLVRRRRPRDERRVRRRDVPRVGEVEPDHVGRRGRPGHLRGRQRLADQGVGHPGRVHVPVRRRDGRGRHVRGGRFLGVPGDQAACVVVGRRHRSGRVHLVERAVLECRDQAAGPEHGRRDLAGRVRPLDRRAVEVGSLLGVAVDHLVAGVREAFRLRLVGIDQDVAIIGLSQAFQGSVWLATYKGNDQGSFSVFVEVLQPDNGKVPLAGAEIVDPDDNDLDGIHKQHDPFEFSAENGMALAAGEKIVLDFVADYAREFGVGAEIEGRMRVADVGASTTVSEQTDAE